MTCKLTASASTADVKLTQSASSACPFALSSLAVRDKDKRQSAPDLGRRACARQTAINGTEKTPGGSQAPASSAQSARIPTECLKAIDPSHPSGGNHETDECGGRTADGRKSGLAHGAEVVPCSHRPRRKTAHPREMACRVFAPAKHLSLAVPNILGQPCTCPLLPSLPPASPPPVLPFVYLRPPPSPRHGHHEGTRSKGRQLVQHRCR